MYIIPKSTNRRNIYRGGERMIRLEEEKPKCDNGHCEHTEEEHEAGVCWHITNLELKDEPTNAKYCPCKRDPEFIRTYEQIEKHEGKGWMEPTKEDIMITKECKNCKAVSLIRVDGHLCTTCERGV